MDNLDTRRLQVLRSIDKFDKIGRDGVVELLQKPASEFGAGLAFFEAELMGRFLDVKGETNAEVLSGLVTYFADVKRVQSRLDLMAALEETALSDGQTAWGLLIAMPANADETWLNGGRPANIGWALDDLLAFFSQQGVSDNG